MIKYFLSFYGESEISITYKKYFCIKKCYSFQKEWKIIATHAGCSQIAISKCVIGKLSGKKTCRKMQPEKQQPCVHSQWGIWWIMFSTGMFYQV